MMNLEIQSQIVGYSFRLNACMKVIINNIMRFVRIYMIICPIDIYIGLLILGQLHYSYNKLLILLHHYNIIYFF